MDKPRNIVIAVNLLWATLLVGLLNGLGFGCRTLHPSLVSVFMVTVVIGTAAVIALLVFKISCRRNWARLTITALFLIGVPACFRISLSELLCFPILGVVMIMNIAAQGCAIYLLFTKSGNAWFEKTKPLAL